MLSAELKETVATGIGRAVPEVQAVFTKQVDGDVLHVWAVVPVRDRDVYRSIYAKEKELIGEFGDIDFDFNVVPSRGRDPRTLISDLGIELVFLRE
jgi:hypothetical protein